METKDYMLKAKKICDAYENRGCTESQCPLRLYQCGLPGNECDMDKAIEFVENFDFENVYPFGKCEKCGFEFDSILINEYEITNCPKCGKKIRK